MASTVDGKEGFHLAGSGALRRFALVGPSARAPSQRRREHVREVELGRPGVIFPPLMGGTLTTLVRITF